ncbi:cell division ATP-binding protein FtsE [Abditibacterium utsteinense]|nr:cell division ATP-binding protein FtsE [Abditibacterium utsteinense]
MIEFHNVTVCYEPDKRHPVRSLDGLSLKIERGDWVFLVGPSGAGKSSLLKLLFADLQAQSGSITVDGEEISRIAAPDVPRLRRKIGIVFQDYQLLSQKTAWENVAFALRVIGTPQSQIVREVPRALETVGLTHRAEAYPHQLSGGEQQRIAIARAIVNDPILLLADEPTGNLDPQTAREVGELLTRINRERGTTIVMATHDGAFVDELKRRVVRLKDGRVVSDRNPGTYAETGDATRDHFPAASPEKTAPVLLPVSTLPQPKSPQIQPEIEAIPQKMKQESEASIPAPDSTKNEAAPTPFVATDSAAPTPRETLKENPVFTPQSTKNEAAISVEETVVPAWRKAPVAPPIVNNDFEVDDFPPPRPMARRIVPAEIAPELPDHSKVASTAHASDPNAPLGSSENPIVQFE